eukprot:TRINITY_DN5195_c0_g1_i1.p1 TRINITY_DN5195_c0_g1~~TRINITY_DN5195_c0_g1_i1.p1  ORF type:complete len:445 (-),score=91.79 TRINITY_DN5195_c0_g1_i1:49-1383(-)
MAARRSTLTIEADVVYSDEEDGEAAGESPKFHVRRVCSQEESGLSALSQLRNEAQRDSSEGEGGALASLSALRSNTAQRDSGEGEGGALASLSALRSNTAQRDSGEGEGGALASLSALRSNTAQRDSGEGEGGALASLSALRSNTAQRDSGEGEYGALGSLSALRSGARRDSGEGSDAGSEPRRNEALGALGALQLDLPQEGRSCDDEKQEKALGALGALGLEPPAGRRYSDAGSDGVSSEGDVGREYRDLLSTITSERDRLEDVFPEAGRRKRDVLPVSEHRSMPGGKPANAAEVFVLSPNADAPSGNGAGSPQTWDRRKREPGRGVYIPAPPVLVHPPDRRNNGSGPMCGFPPPSVVTEAWSCQQQDNFKSNPREDVLLRHYARAPNAGKESNGAGVQACRREVHHVQYAAAASATSARQGAGVAEPPRMPIGGAGPLPPAF